MLGMDIVAARTRPVVVAHLCGNCGLQVIRRDGWNDGYGYEWYGMCVFIYLRHVAVSAGFSMLDEAWTWKV
jgi:hypothetical protein